MSDNSQSNKTEPRAISRCCGAEVDYDGGGYDGEDIAPVRAFCTKCKQTLAINGYQYEVELLNPITGDIIKKARSGGNTIIRGKL